MAKTYGDLITECITFPYSSEYYAMQKECAQISLMADYLECQMFANIHANSIMESRNIEPSYYVESYDDYEIQVLEEKFLDDVKDFGKKAWNAILGILKKFIDLLTKCVNLFDDETSRAQIAARELSRLKMDGQMTNELYQIVVDAVDSANITVTDKSHGGFPFKGDGAVIKLRGVNMKEINPIFDMLSAGLCNTNVIVDASAYKDAGNRSIGTISQVYPISAGDIARIIKMLKSKNDKSVKALEALQTAMNNSLKNGFKISCHPYSLKKTADKLREALSYAESLVTEGVEYYDYDDYMTEGIGDAFNRLREAGKKVTGAIGNAVEERSKNKSSKNERNQSPKPKTGSSDGRGTKPDQSNTSSSNGSSSSEPKPSGGNDGGSSVSSLYQDIRSGGSSSGSSSETTDTSTNSTPKYSSARHNSPRVRDDAEFRSKAKAGRGPNNVKMHSSDDSVAADSPRTVANDTTVLSTVVSALTVVIGMTMRTYNEFISFRQALLPEIEKFVATYGGNLNESVDLDDDDGFAYAERFDDFLVSMRNMVY